MFFIFVGANLIAQMLHFEPLDYLRGGGINIRSQR